MTTYMKPSNIFYSQAQISCKFNSRSLHGWTKIGETLDQLYEGRARITEIPTINVTKKTGDEKVYTLDNRRLWVFHRLEAAGKCDKIPVEIVKYYDCLHSTKFSSTNGGISVIIIGLSDPGGIWHSRITPVVPVVPAVEDELSLVESIQKMTLGQNN